MNAEVVVLYAGPNGEFIPYRTLVVSREWAEKYSKIVCETERKYILDILEKLDNEKKPQK